MDSLKQKLEERRKKNSLRVLKESNTALLDFSSNDYLGLARSEKLKKLILKDYESGKYMNGSTGSRLITGNNELTQKTENYLSEKFNFPACLVFNSGYMANLAIFSSIPQRGDTIIYDELSHACIKDGCRLSLAKRIPFLHNNLEDLERKLKSAEGQAYVACESVYSMDGDMAPLVQLSELCQSHNARLIVDEAHSTGVWGESGAGLVNELGLNNSVFAVVYTFGKGMGIHGAVVAANETVKDFLINFSRPFIYTTAPSAFELISIQCAFDYLKIHPSLQLNVLSKSELFNQQLPGFSTSSPIKSVLIGGNDQTKALATELQAVGFDVRPILSPTVKEGTERLRICLHSFNSEEEIILLCDQLKRHLGQ